MADALATARGELGRRGEAFARAYFEQHGYRILGQNVRLGRHEIDLIVRDGRVTVFVEVKTRRTDQFGTPEEAVTKRKLHHMEQAVARYLRRHPDVSAVRLDVIGVEPTASGTFALRHWRAVGEGARLAFL